MLVAKPFTVSSIHGSSDIKNKCSMRVFNRTIYFFLLDSRGTFHAILGFDLLTRAGVTLNLTEKTIEYQGTTEKLRFHSCDSVNFLDVNDIVAPEIIKKEFRKMILRNIKAFSTSNEALPFNTSVVATIRTEDNEPVFTRLYPHPMRVTDFVNNEIKQLLEQGIIRPSRSRYNSPSWDVDKQRF